MPTTMTTQATGDAGRVAVAGKPRRHNVLRRALSWLGDAVLSWDFGVGLAVGALTYWFVATDPELLAGMSKLHIPGIAFGVGIAGFAQSRAQALSSQLDAVYSKVLMTAHGSVKVALRPFTLVAVAGAVTATMFATLAVADAALLPWVVPLLGAAAIGCGAWSLGGLIDLVRISNFHTEMKAELFQGQDDARRALDD